MFTTISLCPIPTGLEAIVTGFSTATLNWNELFTSDWLIKVSSTSLSNPETETADIQNNTSVMGTVGTYALAGLTANTTYYWYVKSACGSAWSQEATFTTACDVFSVPYFESFEGATMPSCWTIYDLNSNSNKWNVYVEPTASAYHGLQTASVGRNFNENNNDWLITPQFEITNELVMFEFYARARSTNFPENFNVLVSTTGVNPDNFTIIDSITGLNNNQGWKLYRYKLSDYGITAGQNVYIAIQYISFDQSDLDIDAFSIVELPEITCPDDITITESNIVSLSGGLPIGGTYSGEGVTAGSFDPTSLYNGNYTISGCSSSCVFTITVDIVSSINENQTAKIGVYPNPNNGKFNISFDNINGKVVYQIYDTKGSIIVNKNIHTNGNTIEEVSVNLIPGIYFVKVLTTNQSYIEKLVIQ